MLPAKIDFVCLKSGTKYTSEFVNKLDSMLSRNVSSPYKLHCMTENPSGISPNICIDVANGYTDDFVDFCHRVRKHVSKHTIIMAGNVCTPEMVQELILHGGVDIVKIGIGPGSACTTRLKTGVGFPQLSAIIECSHAAVSYTHLTLPTTPYV